MWIDCPYLPNNKAWIKPSKRTLKRRKQRKMKKMNGYAVNCTPPISSLQDLWNITYLDSIPVQPPVVTEMPAQKKGKPMCYDCDYDAPTVENRKLSYVQNRVDSLRWKKQQDLRKMFRLDEVAPTTGEELLDVIKNGKFTLRTAEEIRSSGQYIYSALTYFKWRAPDDKPDQDGFEIATKELEKVTSDTSDVVTLGVYEQQLAALKVLSDWEPSNKPS